MDNLSYQYLDSSFNPDKASQYTLLLRGDSSRFAFAVAEKNKLILLSNHLSWDIFDNTDSNSPLFSNYDRRIIGLPYTAFTLIPVSLFNPEKVADFARFLDVKADEKIFSQPLDDDNQVIFKLCGDILNKVSGRFDLSDLIFPPKGLILTIGGDAPSNQDLYLNILGETVEILNFKDRKLRFYNSFGFTNEDELAYFTTIAANELHLSPESINVIVSGDIASGDRNFDRLKYFFGNVSLNSLKTLTLPRQFPTHASLSLTALSLCGSSAEN
ncbi:MAG TPA: DUF3822 family protein [Mucilaginibacter sp.]|jgi:hypothetical protein|nr:DUF3822 family protein [Mucilaginibacter sp.]